MRKVSVLIFVIAGILVSSCSKKGVRLEKSIPDESFAVASLQPQQLFRKGQINTLEFLMDNIDNDFLQEVVKNPSETGIEMDAYSYMFAYFKNDNPLIGVTAALDDPEKFNAFVKNLIDKDQDDIVSKGEFSFFIPDNDEAAMAWNTEQIIFLASPGEKYAAEDWKSELLSLYDLPKEETITSIVDFNDFTRKMKDMNLWFTGDQIMKIINKLDAKDSIEFDIPLELSNNYGQIFADFQDGAMYVHAETHYSDDVAKAAETFIITKDELNKDLLKLTPGNDLLMGIAFSVKLNKLINLIRNFTPQDMDGVSNQIQQVTGVPGKDILESLSGDLVIAVNGAPEGSAIPVEITIGIGLDDESLEKKMMDQVKNMASVEQDGDFFMINANGIELYSGIVKGIWVITNTPGYKDAVTGKGLDKNLQDSKFRDYSNGSMGMYLNLDFSGYPSALQRMLPSEDSPGTFERISSSLSFMGIEASNSESDVIVKTTKDDENSLYTLLKMLDKTK